MLTQPYIKLYLRQIISSGIIWLIFGLVYAFLEYGIIGRLDVYPATGNKYDFNTSFISISLGSFLMGGIQGGIEILWLKKRFSDKPLWIKLLFKSIFYLILTIIFLAVFALIYNAFLLDVSILNPIVFETLLRFMQKFSFWSIIIYVGLTLNIALFYSEMETYLGSDLPSKFIGKYHKPKQQTQIFMFLDMNSSTTIAEQLGDELYFKLLKTYYADMTDAILQTSGQIYQYVGDEIVVTWDEKIGIKNNNCIQCFYKIARNIEKNEGYYVKTFGLVPQFKAGYHIGKVTTGEIGEIKKEIVHSGDILNTASRLQDKCNELKAKVLITGELKVKLDHKKSISFKEVDELLLRGKSSSVKIFNVNLI